tara:strand:- start:257 stop:1117 length:861 start_codon:yes stop_codon:yes gene_type:complete
MNILITGANGYLAKNFVKEIANKTNHNLILLVRKDADINDLIRYVTIDKIIFYDGSIKSLNKLKHSEVDIIFHLANYYPDSNRLALQEEIIGSNYKLIMDVLTSLDINTEKNKVNDDIRIINITSYVIFDDNIHSLYKYTKLVIYKYLLSKNCQTYILFDTYGKDDPRPKLINYLINYSMSGEKLQMNYTKDSTINLVYLKDVISAFMLAIENKNNTTKENFIYSNTYTLNEVVDTFNKVSKNKINVEWPDSGCQKKSFSFNKAKTTPNNWKPRYNLTMGLTEILK